MNVRRTKKGTQGKRERERERERERICKEHNDYLEGGKGKMSKPSMEGVRAGRVEE